MSNLSTIPNFQISCHADPSAKSGKLIIKGLKLPDVSTNFSALTKIWKSSSSSLSESHGLEIIDIFREKAVKEGYECTFKVRYRPTDDSSINCKDFLEQQFRQFTRILQSFLSSQNYTDYCDYLADGKPDPLVCNLMLDDFLSKTGILTESSELNHCSVTY